MQGLLDRALAGLGLREERVSGMAARLAPIIGDVAGSGLAITDGSGQLYAEPGE